MPCRALIIAPRRVCHLVWPKEQQKWADFEDIRMVLLRGKDREKNVEKEAEAYVINPESLPWLMAEKRFKRINPNILVIDESSKFRRTSSMRFKTIKPILHKFDRRIILTGSPAPKSYLNLFGQIYILDLGKALGQYFTHYRNAYFYQTGYQGFKYELNENAERDIQNAIKPLVLRMDAEDHLRMPKEIINDIVVELDEESRKIYDEMEKELIVKINEGEVLAVNAAVASSKCRQIVNGGVWDSDKKYHHVHDLKTEALLDLIEELNGQPLFVAYQFEHDLLRIQAALGKDTPYLGGGVTDKRAEELEELWNRGEIPVLLGHPSSVGHGLNMQQSSNHICWYSLTWNYEEYDQFNRRLRRQGSSYESVIIHRIVAADTVDEAQILSLNSKHQTQKGLLDALKGYTSLKKDKQLGNFMLYNSKEVNYDVSTKSNPRTGAAVTAKPKEEKMKFGGTPEEDTQEAGLTVDVDNAKLTVKKKAAPKKASKPAKAAKPVKEKKPKESKVKEDDTRKVKVLVKENPKRKGSASYDRFELYFKHDTVAALKKAGLTASNINWDRKHGLIKVG